MLFGSLCNNVNLILTYKYSKNLNFLLFFEIFQGIPKILKITALILTEKIEVVEDQKPQKLYGALILKDFSYPILKSFPCLYEY